MKSRALTVLSISGMALAACSGGQSNNVEPAEVVEDAASAVPQALLEIKEAETGAWAMLRPPSDPAPMFHVEQIPGTGTIEPTATIERFKRAEANDAVGTGALTSGERLEIQKDAVRYASGKTLFGPDGSGTIEELPLRAFSVRAVPPGGALKEQGNDGSEPVVSAGAKTTGLSNTDGVLNHSVEATENGLVFKMGGNAIYYDFQRRFDMGEDVNDWYGRGPDGVRGTADDGTDGSGKWDGCFSDLNGATADCTNWIHDDFKVTFGRPMAAPHGHYAWYWNTRVPLPEGSSASERNLKFVFDKYYSTNRDLGSYELWISNLARIDRGLEDSAGPPWREDDEAKFLDYAAYGLFLPTDELVSWQTPGRLTAFHFGFDAFADSDDARTTDIDSAVTATFRGTTMAQLIHNMSGSSAARPTRIYLRGDILLNARIGGSGGGTISGEISKFEMLGPDRTWHPHAAIIDPKGNDRLVLTGTNYKTRLDPANEGEYTTADYAADAAAVKADGSYEGGVYLQQWLGGSTNRWITKQLPFDDYANTDHAKFGGTFYGPAGDGLENVETAGYWFLPNDSSCDRRSCTDDLERFGPVYGSFGAERMSGAN